MQFFSRMEVRKKGGTVRSCFLYLFSVFRGFASVEGLFSFIFSRKRDQIKGSYSGEIIK